MDTFAVSVCAGLTMPKFNIKKALVMGLYFGVFQAVMPLVGYLAATLFAEKIIAYDHWIAFALLCFLGGKMIIGSIKKGDRPADNDCPCETRADATNPGDARAGITNPRVDKPDQMETSVKPAQMLPLALATSIDALAVGVSFAFLRVIIIPAVSFIGITTFIISLAGVKIGNVFGLRFKSKAELTGGIILVLIGLKILLEHMDIVIF
jgi:putative Mn2+ efflux pump MntP